MAAAAAATRRGRTNAPFRSLDVVLCRAQRGSDEAIGTLLTALRPHLECAVTERLGGDGSNADDVVQETLLTLWRLLPRVRDGDHFARLAFVVARWRAVDHLRSGQVRRRYTGIYNSDLVKEASSCDRAPTEGVDLSGLPTFPRNTMHLHYRWGLSLREIAQLQGRTRGAVKQSLYLARLRLRELAKGGDR